VIDEIAVHFTSAEWTFIFYTARFLIVCGVMLYLFNFVPDYSDPMQDAEREARKSAKRGTVVVKVSDDRLHASEDHSDHREDS